MYHILLLEYFGFRQVVKITTSLVGGGGGREIKIPPTFPLDPPLQLLLS